jgi:hypothetical protein
MRTGPLGYIYFGRSVSAEKAQQGRSKRAVAAKLLSSMSLRQRLFFKNDVKRVKAGARRGLTECSGKINFEECCDYCDINPEAARDRYAIYGLRK